MQLSAGQLSQFLDRSYNLANATILTCLPDPMQGICDFPKQEGCEENPCILIREVYFGERVVEPVMINNRGKKRKFIIQASPFKSFDQAGSETPSLSHSEIVIEECSSALITVAYAVDKLSPGKRYESRVTVKGHCEQKIKVVAHVLPREAVRCTVVQKECEELRRHKWQDHFYCESPVAREKSDFIGVHKALDNQE